MAQNNLETLLFRIRDGDASNDEVAAARALVQSDVRLPEELREVVDFNDDPIGDAVGLLSVLGADSLFGEVLREAIALEAVAAEPEITAEKVDAPWEWSEPFVAAVRYEAGEVEIAAEVLARLGLPAFELPLASAIRSEAGSVELVALIEASLTDLGLPLAEAIRAEAGTVEVADAVLVAVGGEARLPVAEAVRAEAGTVEVWKSIEPSVSGAWVSAMLDRELSSAAHRGAVQRLHQHPGAREQMTAFASIGNEIRTAIKEEGGDCPYVWDAVATAIGVQAEAVEGWDETLLAAAVRSEAGSVNVVDSVLSELDRRAKMPTSLAEAPSTPVAANRGFNLGTLLMMAAAALLVIGLPQMYRGSSADNGVVTTKITDSGEQFASANEIIVESLDYGENSNVYQATGDQGALILWVDEGKTL